MPMVFFYINVSFGMAFDVKILMTYLSSLLAFCLVPTITVMYTIMNDLVGTFFKYSIMVNVPEGSILLAVLEEAQRVKPNEFR